MIERVRIEGGIELAYERLGDGPPVLLIMGIGAQLVGWPDGFCAALVERGLQVVRFDNRDVGESTHLTGTPDLRDPRTAGYTLHDLARDTVGLMDALGLDGAHLVGASMGGFIAQTVAIDHPARVRSLTSMMSTTGAPGVGQPHPEALALFARGTPRTRDEVVATMVQAARVVGSTAFEVDLEAAAARAGRAYDRGYDPGGMLRQAAAVIASGDRTEALGHVRVPALVIHGTADRMIDVSGGRATAAAIPGAELWLVDGLGHDLPRALWPALAARIAALVTRSDAAG